jgi:hypothetical protein
VKIFTVENRYDAEKYDGQVFWCGETPEEVIINSQTLPDEAKRTLSGVFDSPPYFRMHLGFYFNCIGVEEKDENFN